MIDDEPPGPGGPGGPDLEVFENESRVTSIKATPLTNAGPRGPRAQHVLVRIAQLANVGAGLVVQLAKEFPDADSWERVAVSLDRTRPRRNPSAYLRILFRTAYQEYTALRRLEDDVRSAQAQQQESQHARRRRTNSHVRHV